MIPTGNKISNGGNVTRPDVLPAHNVSQWTVLDRICLVNSAVRVNI